MCSGARRSSSGFSLLDAVAATGLLGVALLGLSAGPLTIVRNARMADSVSVATALAQQEIERLRNLPIGAPELSPGTVENPGNLLTAAGTPGGGFRRNYTVSGEDIPRPGLVTVTVDVRWADERPHLVTLAAVVRCPSIPCP
jgi:hypothetical protein